MFFEARSDRAAILGVVFVIEAFTTSELEPNIQHWQGVCVCIYGYVEWNLMRIGECTVTVGGW